MGADNASSASGETRRREQGAGGCPDTAGDEARRKADLEREQHNGQEFRVEADHVSKGQKQSATNILHAGGLPGFGGATSATPSHFGLGICPICKVSRTFAFNSPSTLPDSIASIQGSSTSMRIASPVTSTRPVAV